MMIDYISICRIHIVFSSEFSVIEIGGVISK
jgi:hypothetical protein